MITLTKPQRTRDHNPSPWSPNPTPPTPAERHAIQVALRTADTDFTRSPGLKARMQHSLRKGPGRGPGRGLRPRPFLPALVIILTCNILFTLTCYYLGKSLGMWG